MHTAAGLRYPPIEGGGWITQRHKCGSGARAGQRCAQHPRGKNPRCTRWVRDTRCGGGPRKKAAPHRVVAVVHNIPFYDPQVSRALVDAVDKFRFYTKDLYKSGISGVNGFAFTYLVPKKLERQFRMAFSKHVHALGVPGLRIEYNPRHPRRLLDRAGPAGEPRASSASAIARSRAAAARRARERPTGGRRCYPNPARCVGQIDPVTQAPIGRGDTSVEVDRGCYDATELQKWLSLDPRLPHNRQPFRPDQVGACLGDRPNGGRRRPSEPGRRCYPNPARCVGQIDPVTQAPIGRGDTSVEVDRGCYDATELQKWLSLDPRLPHNRQPFRPDQLGACLGGV